MPTDKDQIALLTEIRDMLREQVSMTRVQFHLTEHDKKMSTFMSIARAIFTTIVVVFVVGAVYMYYSTIAGMIPRM